MTQHVKASQKMSELGVSAPWQAFVQIRLQIYEKMLADPDVTAALSPAEIEEKFDLGYHTKHVDTIFKRVFGES